MIIGIILMFLTLLVLVSGIILMAFGGKLNKKYSKILMSARVVLQFLAVISLFLLYIFAKQSS
jgi:hypothetical protein